MALGEASALLPAHPLIFVYALFPFLWALRSAFTPENELFRTPVKYFPTHPTLENFRQGAEERRVPAGAPQLDDRRRRGDVDRADARRLRGLRAGTLPFPRPFLTLYIVLSMTIFPQIAILGALYTMINRLGLYDRLGR